MWDKVGIVRTNEGLQYAKSQIVNAAAEIDAEFKSHKPTRALIEYRNLVDTARLMINSAIDRKENRGLHYNKDLRQNKTTRVHQKRSFID